MHYKQKALSLLLTAAMVLSLVPAAALAAEADTVPSMEGTVEPTVGSTNSSLITAFADLAQTAYEVENGEAAPILPEAVTATVGGAEATVAVTWNSEPEFDATTAGEYTFTASAEGYTLDEAAEGLTWPTVTVTVKEAAAEQPTQAPAPVEEVKNEVSLYDAIGTSVTWDDSRAPSTIDSGSGAVAVTVDGSVNCSSIVVKGSNDVTIQGKMTGAMTDTLTASGSFQNGMIVVGEGGSSGTKFSGTLTLKDLTLDAGLATGLSALLVNWGWLNNDASHQNGSPNAKIVLENVTFKTTDATQATLKVTSGTALTFRNVTFAGGTVTLGVNTTVEGDTTVEGSVTLGAAATLNGTVTLSGGGTIKRADAYAGHLFTLGSGADVTLQNITVDGNSEKVHGTTQTGSPGDARALFSLSSTAKLTLDTGAVLQNNDGGFPYGGSSAGAVLLSGSANLAMKGNAKIQNCASEVYGGAVLVGTSNDNSTKFTMLDTAVISGCTGKAQFGNAVCVWGGAFDMQGGEIKGNSGAGKGAVGLDTAGSITMSGGSITGNTSAANGGGVTVGGGTFTMTGGTIANNTAKNGGGIYVNKGTVNLNKGTISGNKGTSGSNGFAGGGVTVMGGTVTLGDGTPTNSAPDMLIQGNEAHDGAGVIIGNSSTGDGTLTIKSDAKISGNSGSYGAGVYAAKGTVTIDGAAITGNTAIGGGAGLMVYDADNPVILTGKVTISGNEKLATPDAVLGADGNSKDNVRLNNGTAKLKLTAALDPAASVGVHTAANNSVHNSQTLVVADTGAIAAASLPCFFDDAGTLGIRQDATANTNLVWGAEGNSMDDVYVANATDGSITHGDDSAAGTKEAPVLTLNEAYRRVKTNGTIHVMNELSAARNLDCNEDKTVTILTDTNGDLTDTETAVAVKRASGFTAAPVLTVSKGGVTLKNITVDGNRANVTAAASLISVGAEGALTLADKAAVQNSSKTGIMTGTITSEGKLTIEAGAKVTGNKSYDGGGVLLVNGTLTMTGGEISGNEATGYGGGLYLLPNASGTGPNHPVANISGGAIKNNFVSSSANTTGGAGIMIHGNSVVNLSGDVAVTGNGLKNATGSLASNGAGIHLYMTTSKLTVAGKVVIDNNTLGATLTGGTLTPGSIQSDVGLKTGATVSLKGALTSGSHIGVYTQKMPTTLGETVDVGVGDGYAVTAADAGVFFSNRPTQAGVKFADGKVVLAFDARSEKVTVGVDGTNTGKTTVTVSGTESGRYYGVKDNAGNITWKQADASGKLVFDNLESGKNYQVISKTSESATNSKDLGTVTTPSSDFADLETENVVRWADAPDTTKDKIVIKGSSTKTDQEYAVVNKETGEVSEWKTGTANDANHLTFEGLDPNGTYEVVTRDKDVDTSAEGNQPSGKGQGLISGPRVEKTEVKCGNDADGKGSITVNPSDPALDYIVIDPTTGKAATGMEWKQGNDGKLTFTGLNNETKYAVATRPHGAEDITAEGLVNAITGGWKKWTPTVPVVAPKEDGGYKNNAVNNSKREFNNTTTDDGKDKITIQGADGYSYGVRAKNADGTYTYYKADGTEATGADDTGAWLSGTGDKIFASLPAGKDYEICKYKDSIKASGGADSTYYYAVTKVPTLPPTVGENDITTAIQNNGKASITVDPASSDYDYILLGSDGKVVNSAHGNGSSVTFPDLKPGTEYKVLTQPVGTLPAVGTDMSFNPRVTKVETPVIDLSSGSVTAGVDPADGTKTQIVIDPASDEVKYVVIDKTNSNTVAGVGITDVAGGKVTIGGLTPGHDYTVVTVPKNESVTVGTTTIDPTTKPGAVGIKTPNTADANVTGKLPTAEQITSDSSSITINPTQAGMEYNLVDKNSQPVGNWKPTPAGNGVLTFTGLSSSTEYTVVMRPAGADVSGELPLTGPSKTTTAGGSSSSSSSSSGGSSSGVTAGKTEHGKVKIDKPNASKGQTVTVTVTPDPGYELGKLTVTDKKGNELEAKDLGNGKYSFVMPADKPVKIETTFVETAATGDPETNGVSKLLVTDDHIAYMKGDEQGNFRPEGNITRAETAQMFYNLLKDKNVTGQPSFTDVSGEAWYAKAVNALAGLGIVQGVGEDTYEPDRAITRAEFVAIAMRFATNVTGTKAFTDVGEDYWAHDYITGAAYYGWINGYTDGSFKPTAPITRAEAATVVNNMLNREGDKTFIDKAEDLKLFPDMAKDYWAFLDIVEATNAHDFTRDTHGVESWGK